MTKVCCIIIVLLKIYFVSGAYRAARSTGVQPDEGKCYAFKWGGSSHLHWWICCNNCINGVPDTCDGKTYHTASREKYCESCGVNKGRGKIHKHQFACGGCSGQQATTDKCTKFWRKIPGMCWSFLKCFYKHCPGGISKRSASSANLEKCNVDGVCDPGETPENCPVDCCYKKNSVCTWKDKCLPECCGESTCCLVSDADSRQAGGFYQVALLGLVNAYILKALYM